MISFVKIFTSALIDFECDLQMPENCLKYYHYNMRISYDFVSLVIAVRTGVLLNTLNLELMAWGGEYGFISLLLFSTASRAEVLTPHSSRSFLLSSRGRNQCRKLSALLLNQYLFP